MQGPNKIGRGEMVDSLGLRFSNSIGSSPLQSSGSAPFILYQNDNKKEMG